MSRSIKAFAEPIRTRSGIITSATYLPLATSTGVAALPHPARIVHIQNLTGQPVFISMQPTGAPVPAADGSQDMFILNSESFILLDISSDSALPAGEFYIAEGTIFYVRAQNVSTLDGTAVWLSVIYGQNIQ